MVCNILNNPSLHIIIIRELKYKLKVNWTKCSVLNDIKVIWTCFPILLITFYNLDLQLVVTTNPLGIKKKIVSNK